MRFYLFGQPLLSFIVLFRLNWSCEEVLVELKRGHASDAVVRQIQKYMGYVKEDVAEDDQRVCGVIIALDDDK